MVGDGVNAANVDDYTPLLIERPWNSLVAGEHRINWWENALGVILPIVEAKRREKERDSCLPTRIASAHKRVDAVRDKLG